MVKRKLRQNQKVSDDEIESQRPSKQFKKRNSTEITIQRILSSSKVDHDSSGDSDACNFGETSGTAANDSHFESFSSFMKTYFDDENEDEHQKFKSVPQIPSNGCKNSMDETERRKPEEVSHPTSSSQEDALNKELEDKFRIASAPSKLCEIVLLQHPASLTLHGYVKVTVLHGSICIFGYEVKERDNITVFSTEGTGWKKLNTLKPKHKLDLEDVKRDIRKKTCHETNIDVEEFMSEAGPESVVIIVEKILLPAPLRFLELYYPNALQTRWPKKGTPEAKDIAKKERMFKLCSAEQSYVIHVGCDFKMLSQEVINIICLPAVSTVPDNVDFGSRILIRGEKNAGKSTLLRYLMNSFLNKLPEVYFLDTDPGQTEYTPPGVVSLFRVTKPLLGPPFAHQKKPLKMFFTGSISAGTSPKLYEECVIHLMKFFNKNFSTQTLFVNTMGWVQGVGKLCLQNVRDAVKPTIEIELISPDPNIQFTKELDQNGVTIFKVPSKAPSKESGTASYKPAELRTFNLMAYLGQCQKPYMPVSLINSFHPVCVSWDKIALYVMGKKVPAHRLVEAIHCSIVALCRVDLSYVLKSDNPDYPMTLNDEPICECLGFGLVRASDEKQHIFYIVTPLTVDQLKNVNALVKGNIVIPDEIFLKQTILGKPLPFTNRLRQAKNPGLKGVPKRAFRNTLTPKKT